MTNNTLSSARATHNDTLVWLHQQHPDLFDGNGGRAASAVANQLDAVIATARAELSKPTFNEVVPKRTRVKRFIDNCVNIVEYWSDTADTPQEAAEGVMGSVLNLLDGGGDCPPMDLIPTVIPELVAEYNEKGVAGWPAESINNDTDLQGRYAKALKKRMAMRLGEAVNAQNDAD